MTAPSPLPTPPPNLPPAEVALVSIVATVSPSLIVTTTAPSESDTLVLLYSAECQPASAVSPKLYTYIGTLWVGPVATPDVTERYLAHFGAPFVGGRFFVKVYCVRSCYSNHGFETSVDVSP